MASKKTSRQFVVGFALETDNELINAKEKFKKKNLDMIVLNSLNNEKSGFKYNTNKITIIDKKNNIYNYELKDKLDVAKDIIDEINFMLKEKNIHISSYLDDEQEDWDSKLELSLDERKDEN